MKSRIISLFVMLAFVLTLGLGNSFAQDTTKAKPKHKAKVEKKEKAPVKTEKKEKAPKVVKEKKMKKVKKDTTAAK